MAAAVLEIFPKSQLGVGPSIEDGFYHDFDLSKTISPEDLPKIEKKMREMIKEDIPFKKTTQSIDQALKEAQSKKLEYRTKLIQDLKKEGEKEVSFYQTGDFINLCKGPHIKSTKEINLKAFKLTKLAGAYWKGDEKNKMLTRIYGIAFETEKELKEYLIQQEEAEKRNHVKLGQKLDLFSMHEEGPGFPFFHPKGIIIWNEIMKYWKEEHDQEGYGEITTPIILNKKLWEQSGHWDHYKENMYFTKIDKNDYAVKPMNCPGGILVYKSRPHSYREMPIKIAEVGLVHRHELSGTLNGLFRVRAFKQDDAHIYCLKNQIKDEVIKVIKLIDRLYKTYGLKYHMELSTRPKKSIGTTKMWQEAEKSLEDALKSIKADYKLNPGDGAFYGPKIDFHIKDAINRTWQCGTIQLDFAMPEKFKLEYISQKGEKDRPVMIHRTAYGGVERFLGILIEHYAGAFPTWLSPVQAQIIPISQKFNKYAEEVKKQLREEKIRIELNDSDETLGKKIREGQLQKIPYLLIVGEKEEKAQSVAVRDREKGDLGLVKIDQFIEKIKKEIEEKK